jgi:hypothetical protein
MPNLDESWARTRGHLTAARHAACLIGDLRTSDELAPFDEFFGQSELGPAAEALLQLGRERDDLSRGFWDLLRRAFENLALEPQATLCRFRAAETERGYVEARLALVATASGGRARPIFTDYRASWNLGRGAELDDAPITIEDRQALQPGEIGVVRLHPLWPEAWGHLHRGAAIAMHEGARVVGHATVRRIVLKQP